MLVDRFNPYEANIIIIKMENKTTYDIIHTGISIFPELNRDEYYKQEWIKKKDVKQSIEELKEAIRLSPNRDDKIKATILYSDGGGIGKFELYKMINKILGEELTK